MFKKKLHYTTALGAVVLASGWATTPVFAQDGASAGSSDVVITVGTRRDARSAVDAPVPIDVVDSEELLNQGDTDIQNILRTSVPSYNVNTQPISDAATLVRPANLRGLAPDSTLVLVNGKRRHRAAVISFLGGGISDGSQGPDISVIPTIALKQVEVLRDGASSIYGSDAIAGVINFELRDSAEGASFEAEWGQTYEGDGDQYSISANVGLPLPIVEDGFINLSVEYGEINDTIRSVQRDDAAALIAAGNTDVTDISVNTITSDYTQLWGQPNVNDDFTFFANMAVPFSETVELYAFGNYSERNVDGGFFYRNPNTRSGVFSNDGGETLLVADLTDDMSGACPTITITDNVPDPTALADVIADPDCFVFNEIAPGGFVPRFGGDLQDQSIAVGLRGEFDNGLGYDVSFYYGENDIVFFINNTVNASLGPDTPRDFTPGGYNQTDMNFNADFTYDFANSMFASDIGVAFGFEHREETFTITQGDDASFTIGPLAAQGFSSSSNGFGGFTPASAGPDSQKNYAVYLESGADITDSFYLEAAVRYEDFYDSFGDTLNYKVAGLYTLNDNVRLRSSYSTGFHAPSAGQANVTNITTSFSGTVLVDQGTLPLSSNAGQFIADDLEALTGVRPALGPEESKNFTAGVGFSLGDIDFTVDYFRIKVTDRISISDQQNFVAALARAAVNGGLTLADVGITADSDMDSDIDAEDDSSLTTQQIITVLDGASIITASDFAGSEDLTTFGFFSNSFDTRTQGIDVVASTSYEFSDNSNTDIALAFNWTDTKVTDSGLDGAAPLSVGRRLQLEDNVPEFRGNLTINHFVGPFRGLARVNYYGSFFECHLDAVNNDPATGCDLPIDGDSQITLDLEAGYNVTDNVQIIAGAQNVTDSYVNENPWSGVVGAKYPVTAPAGFAGGLYYFKIRADF